MLLGYGPSPRTWGLRRHSTHISGGRRSIPTHVGFTRSGPLSHDIEAVHPHARGVYASRTLAYSVQRGPSPRTWGLRKRNHRPGRPIRSIPTHVGFTPGSRQRPGLWPVHPHARGVYDLTPIINTGITGPSPRTWGLRRLWDRQRHSFRSIPTHVGFTPGYGIGRCSPAVHPHARGVYVTDLATETIYDGPSPRTWGLLLK